MFLADGQLSLRVLVHVAAVETAFVSALGWAETRLVCVFVTVPWR